MDTAAYRSRARYLLELDHHVGEDLLQSVLGLLRSHGLSCDVTGGSDGDKYILVMAPFQVLAAQVFVVLRLSIFSVNLKSLTVEVSLHGMILASSKRKRGRA